MAYFGAECKNNHYIYVSHSLANVIIIFYIHNIIKGIYITFFK